MFAIVVSDNEAPIISDCPSSQTLTTELGSETATAIWVEPKASDNSNNVTLTPSRSGDAFPVGQNTVTYAAQDPSGNTATCTFVISVTARGNAPLASYILRGHRNAVSEMNAGAGPRSPTE
eukprot:XP_011674813.1 PREDICTED: hyalin-like [Strongylocentrotus purpuratus]